MKKAKANPTAELRRLKQAVREFLKYENNCDEGAPDFEAEWLNQTEALAALVYPTKALCREGR